MGCSMARPPTLDGGPPLSQSGLVDLRRGDAEVGEDAVDLPDALGRQHGGERREVRVVNGERATAAAGHRRQPLAGQLDVGGVEVRPDHPPARQHALEQQRGVPMARQNMRELNEDTVVRADAEAGAGQFRRESHDRAARAGEAAVDAAEETADLKDSDSEEELREVGKKLAKGGRGRRPGQSGAGRAPAADGAGDRDAGGPAAENYGYKEAQNYAQQARVVNGRSFFQNGSVWTDSTAQAQEDLKQKEVAFNSDEYFDLLAAHPDAAQWLALGNEVDVVLGDTLYVIR